LALAQMLAAERNLEQQEVMKKQYDKKAAPHKFQVGQRVLLHDPTKKKGLSKKLSNHYTGPYTIAKCVNEVNVELEGMGSKSTLVHVNRLKLYPEPSKNSIRNIPKKGADGAPTPDGSESQEEPEEPTKITDQLCQLVKSIGKKSKNTNTKPMEGPISTQQKNEIEVLDATPVELISLKKKVDRLATSTAKPKESGVEGGEMKSDTREKQRVPPPRVQQIIIDHRRRRQHLEYLVRGLNDPVSAATWVKISDITDKDMILDYTRGQTSYPATRSRRRVHPTINAIRPGNRTPDITFSLMVAIILFILWWPTTLGSSVPDLGVLYNCEATKYAGVYTLPKGLDCDNVKATPEKINNFEALIKQYHPKTTRIPIYHCTAYKVTLKCREDLVFTKQHSRSSEEIQVTAEDCIRAVRYKMFKNIHLRMVRPGTWGNMPHKNYDCAYMSTKRTSYIDARMFQYTGQLEGADTRIHNDLTSTTCDYKRRYCTPIEQPNSSIVWERTVHAFKIYRSLGVHPVKQLGTFILVPNLAIGGTIVTETKYTYLLDVGYQIIRKNNGTYHTPLAFQNYSDYYVSNTKSNAQRDVAEGKIARRFMHDFEVATHMVRTTCIMNQEIRQLQRCTKVYIECPTRHGFPVPLSRTRKIGHHCRRRIVSSGLC
jgi:hypothetical protein